MTNTAAPTFQSMIDEAEAGSTIVLKKGVYNIDGTLKINKALTIRAEEGCPHEVSECLDTSRTTVVNDAILLSGCRDQWDCSSGQKGGPDGNHGQGAL
jgi:hypothetical protein